MADSINVYANKFQKALTVLEPCYSRGLENARYYRGDNWTTRDIEAHYKQGFFHAYSIPLIATKLNRILSVQRANRFDAVARGRGMEDELTAEVYNLLFKYIDDKNKFKYTESEIFQDGIAKLFGVLKIDVDKSFHPLGDITMTKTPFYQFYWDTNSIDYMLGDATFMGEYRWIPLDKAQALFPDYNFNGAVQLSGDGTGLLNGIYNYLTNVFNTSRNSVNLTDWLDEKNKLVKVCEHYEKQYSKRYIVKNFKTGDYQPFKSKKEAEDFIIGQIQGEQKAILSTPGYSKTFTDDDFAVIDKELPIWKRIIFSGNQVINKTDHQYSKPPYFRYCALFDDGEFWSLTDLAKDSQKAYDRATSMIDKSTAKNIKGNNYTINIDRLHPSETKDIDKLANRLSGGGQFVKVVGTDVITPINKINDIRVEAGLVAQYQSLVEDLLGGRQYQGLDGQSKQTATEVVAVERNAAQSGLLFADNLARWKQTAYEYLVEVIKDVYTPDRTIRVIGEIANQKVQASLEQSGIYKPSPLYTGEMGYLDLSKLEKPLYDCELDIVIDNVEHTAMDKDQKMNQLLALNQIGLQYGYPPLPYEMLLEYSKIDATLKDELIKFQQQAQAQVNEEKKQMADMEKAKTLTNIIKDTKPEAQEVSKRGSPQQIQRINA